MPPSLSITRKSPLTQSFAVRPGQIYDLDIDLRAEELLPNGAVASFKFFGENGEVLSEAFEKFRHSSNFENYLYIPCSEISEVNVHKTPVKIPPNVRSVEVSIVAWRTKILTAHGPLALSSIVPVTPTSPLVERFRVEAGHVYEFGIDLRTKDEPLPNGAVASFTFLGENGEPLIGPFDGYSRSSRFEAYHYVRCTTFSEINDRRMKIVMPPRAWSVEVKINAWRAQQLSAHGPILLTPRGAQDAVPSSKAAPEGRDAASKGASAARSQRQLLSRVAFACAEYRSYVAKARLRIDGEVYDKAAMLAVAFFDAKGDKIPGPYLGFVEASVGWYAYLGPQPGHGTDADLQTFLVAPAGAVAAHVDLHQWAATSLSVIETLDVVERSWDDHLKALNLSRVASRELRRLMIYAGERGDIHANRRLSAILAARGENTGNQLRLLDGLARELDTGWLPHLRARKPDRPWADERTVMHLLKVIYPQESSGGAVRSWNILKTQALAGWQPVAVLSAQKEEVKDPLADAAGKDGRIAVRREGVDVVYTRLSSLERRSVAPDAILDMEVDLAARELVRHRCGIVHAASGFKGFDNALKGAALARRFDLPFVYEVRSFHEHTWSPLRPGVLEAPLTLLRRAQEVRCMQAADAVVTISQAMVSELENLGIPGEKIFLVPNAVDDHFCSDPDPAGVAALREKFGLEGKTAIGYVSNISRREGHRVLLQAFAEAATRIDDAVCVIVGDGPERAAVEQLARDLELGDRVIFTGELDHAAIREVYGMIDVFVVPRLEDYASDFVTPMKPFEAMAAGSKLIMSDRPVSAEIVGNEERGALFRTNDAGHLCAKILELIHEPQQADERARAAKSWVLRERNWRRNIEIYGETYAYARAAREAAAGSAAARPSRVAASERNDRSVFAQ